MLKFLFFIRIIFFLKGHKHYCKTLHKKDKHVPHRALGWNETLE
jgi:hypothetical protein